ncbi:hypothetical protein FVE85_0194 [Porphyridium purpureum]|uniref:Glycosyltransferase 2-like domain-containing protein n=1 Tax=Porphyridium purpureum TaxID=35688 RepID=A0A5J4YZB6_PORPP|nr:hypothetical protein FVE85_0194 [Porphyridium purpureum]|eukprot:POR1610..scf208_2
MAATRPQVRAKYLPRSAPQDALMSVAMSADETLLGSPFGHSGTSHGSGASGAHGAPSASSAIAGSSVLAAVQHWSKRLVRAWQGGGGGFPSLSRGDDDVERNVDGVVNAKERHGQTRWVSHAWKVLRGYSAIMQATVVVILLCVPFLYALQWLFETSRGGMDVSARVASDTLQEKYRGVDGSGHRVSIGRSHRYDDEIVEWDISHVDEKMQREADWKFLRPDGPGMRAVLLAEVLKRRAAASSVPENERLVPGGVSLVAACSQHWVQMSMTIQSWTKVKGVDEVIFVDWSSTAHSARVAKLFGDESVFVVHINRTDWMPSRAFNLGVRLAQYANILKVDCDTQFIGPAFLEHHRIGTEHALYTVSAKEKSTDRAALRSVFYTKKETLEAVGGFDERLTEPGYECEDLYVRMGREVKLAMYDFDLKHVRRIPFDEEHYEARDAGRTDTNLSLEKVHSSLSATVRNRLLVEELNASAAGTWTRLSKQTQYSFIAAGEPTDAMTLLLAEPTASEQVPSGWSIVGELAALEISIEANMRVLHEEVGVPLAVLEFLSEHNLSAISYLTELLDPTQPRSVRPVFAVVSARDVHSMSVSMAWALALGARDEVMLLVFVEDGTVDPWRVFDVERMLVRMTKFGLAPAKVMFAGPWPCTTTVNECSASDPAYMKLADDFISSSPGAVVLDPEHLSVVHYARFIDREKDSAISDHKTDRDAFASLTPYAPLKKDLNKLTSTLHGAVALVMSNQFALEDIPVWLDEVVKNEHTVQKEEGVEEGKPLMVVLCSDHDRLELANAHLKSRATVEVLETSPLSSVPTDPQEAAFWLDFYHLEIMLRCARIYLDRHATPALMYVMRYTLAWRKFNAPSLPQDMRRHSSNMKQLKEKAASPRFFQVFFFKSW